MKSLVTLICFFALASIGHAAECTFAGENGSTSLEHHLKLIKHTLNGPESSKYLVSCGAFIGNDRYYNDLLDPQSKKLLEEIRGIKGLKVTAYNALRSAKPSNENYLDLIDVNANWKNDNRVATLLIRFLYSKDSDVRMTAAGALKGTTSPAAIGHLLKMTKSSNAGTRYWAAAALEGTTVSAARKALIEMRNDSDSGVRAQAIVGTL